MEGYIYKLKNRKMNTKISGLTFQPWIPESYYDSNNPYGKLLILGESHYGVGEEESNSNDVSITETIVNIGKGNQTTSIVVDGYISRKWDINFFRNLGLSFNKEDRYEIWKNAAFANAIQKSLVGADSQPTREEIETIKPALWLLIENLKPQKMLVCSQRMWQYWLPDEDSRCNLIGHIAAEEKKSNVWRYKHEDGFCYAIAINHPSKFFSYESFTPLIKKFITTKF